MLTWTGMAVFLGLLISVGPQAPYLNHLRSRSEQTSWIYIKVIKHGNTTRRIQHVQYISHILIWIIYVIYRTIMKHVDITNTLTLTQWNVNFGNNMYLEATQYLTNYNTNTVSNACLYWPICYSTIINQMIYIYIYIEREREQHLNNI